MNFKTIGMICVVVSALIEALGQVAFKRAAETTASTGAMAGVRVFVRAPGWITLGLLCFGVEAAFYSASLRLLDLSLAFPVGSLCFVGVIILSGWWLRETISPRRWLGVALIVAGTLWLGAS